MKREVHMQVSWQPQKGKADTGTASTEISHFLSEKKKSTLNAFYITKLSVVCINNTQYEASEAGHFRFLSRSSTIVCLPV